MIATMVAVLLQQASGPPVHPAQAGSPIIPEVSAPSSGSTAPPDAAKLAVARQVAEAIWPAGTLARMYGGTGPSDVADAVFPRLPAFGTDDPHFAERMLIMRRLLAAEMAPLWASREPLVRAALANAYARRFGTADLQAAATFFATPAGRAIAAETHLMTLDPAVVRLITPSFQDTMTIMATVEKKLEHATKHLPPVPNRKRGREAKVQPKP